MNKKALLVLIPLLATLSLLVMPAFAIATYPSIQACGWASVKTCEGRVSGCATLYVVLGVTDGMNPTQIDELEGNYVLLMVRGHTFEWVIDPSSVKCKYNVLTLRAYPLVFLDATSDGQGPTSPLSPITVVVNLCKPYCVTASGCSAFFAGQGQPLTPG